MKWYKLPNIQDIEIPEDMQKEGELKGIFTEIINKSFHDYGEGKGIPNTGSSENPK